MSASTAVPFSARRRRLALIGILSCIFAAGLAIGVFIPLTTLVLDARGYSATVVGLNSAMPALAIIVCGPFAARLIARLGAVPAAALGAVACALLMASVGFVDHLGLWLALRFLGGAAMTLPWVASETWLNQVAPEGQRGRIMGLYATVIAVGFALGPALVRWVGTEGLTPFLLGGGLMLIAVPPIALARGIAVDEADAGAGAGTAWWAVRAAPVVIGAGLAGGAIEGATYVLLPLYALALSFSEADALTMLAVFMAGNIVLQLPIGWLADRFDRYLVLAVCTAIILAGAVLLPWAIQGAARWAFLFVWGGAIMGLYTLGLVLLGQRFSISAMAAANAALVMAYNLGSLTGPLFGGGAMDLWRPHGPIAVFIAIPLFYLLAIASRARRHAAADGALAKARPAPPGGS